MEEMDIYEKSSLEGSISNFIMLKAFHDAGVDVYSLDINDYFVNVYYGYDCSLDILENCCNKLFDEVQKLDFYEIEDEETYRHLFDGGTPEYAILIKDSLITEVLSSSYKEELSAFIDEQSNKVCYSETTISWYPNENLLIVEVYCYGMFHEVAIGLVNILKKAEEIKKKLEESKENGISHKANRETA